MWALNLKAPGVITFTGQEGHEMGIHTLSVEQMRQIAEVLRGHGVVHAALFGSYARGQASDRSDVDILVEFAGAVSLFDVADLELTLADLLGRPVEIITYRALNPRIKDVVLQEQVGIL